MNLLEYIQSIESNTEIWEKRPYVEKHPQNSEDLTGKKFGDFKVSGYSPHLKRWVVRCSCGFHELRTSKSIKNIKNDIDKCSYCRRTDYIIKTVPNLKGIFDFKSLFKKYKIQRSEKRLKEQPKVIQPPVIEVEKVDLFITKHACLRYISRVENVSVSRAKNIIKTIVESHKKGTSNSFSIVSRGCLFLVRDNRVITVINHNRGVDG